MLALTHSHTHSYTHTRWQTNRRVLFSFLALPYLKELIFFSINEIALFHLPFLSKGIAPIDLLEKSLIECLKISSDKNFPMLMQ